MRFLDGITETRKAGLMGQLRAVWTHDSMAIHPFYDGNGRLARLIADLSAFRSLVKDAWQTTLDLVKEARCGC